MHGEGRRVESGGTILFFFVRDGWKGEELKRDCAGKGKARLGQLPGSLSPFFLFTTTSRLEALSRSSPSSLWQLHLPTSTLVSTFSIFAFSSRRNERANDVVSPLLSLSSLPFPFPSLALPSSLLFSVRAQKSLALVEASPSYSATEGFKAYVSLSLFPHPKPRRLLVSFATKLTSFSL